jgi:hypothetical protein
MQNKWFSNEVILSISVVPGMFSVEYAILPVSEQSQQTIFPLLFTPNTNLVSDVIVKVFKSLKANCFASLLSLSSH